MPKTFLKQLIAVLALLFAANSALAGSPQRFVVFGDSLSDPGNAFVLIRDLEIPPFDNLIPDAPYARGAFHFSNGATWVEQLSLLEHALPTAGPALFIPKLFSNYAVGGARARREGPFDLSTQVGVFLSDFDDGVPKGALFVVFAGGNDLRDALQVADPTFGASLAIVQAAVNSIGNALGTLHAAGAQRFLVPNAPDISLAPSVRLAGPQAQGAAQFLSAQFNLRLEAKLQELERGPGLEIVRLNVFALLSAVAATPAAFGLVDASNPCIALNTKRNAFCAQPDKFLFWDGIHPTKAGHRLLAEQARAALDAAALATAP